MHDFAGQSDKGHTTRMQCSSGAICDQQTLSLVYMLKQERVSRSHVHSWGNPVRHGCCAPASSHAWAQTCGHH